jgi:anti-sigma B factor antagonist
VDLAIIEDAPQGCAIVKLSGELDLACAPDLRERLLDILDRGRPSRLILDLSELAFIDSSGTAVLVNTDRRARLIGCTLALVTLQAPVARVLQVSGLDRYFLIFDDLSAAAASAQADPLDSIPDRSDRGERWDSNPRHPGPQPGALTS